MTILNNITTISSAFIFILATVIPTCPRVYSSIVTLIFSSLVYKYIYIYHPQMTKLLDFSTKFDHLCIMNIFLAYYDTMQYWKSLGVQMLTIVDYRFMYFFFGYFMCHLFVDFVIYRCYFLLFIFALSTCIGLYAYFDYTKKGWTKYNSWLWHYANMCIILCVKLCENNLYNIS